MAVLCSDSKKPIVYSLLLVFNYSSCCGEKFLLLGERCWYFGISIYPCTRDQGESRTLSKEQQMTILFIFDTICFFLSLFARINSKASFSKTCLASLADTVIYHSSIFLELETLLWVILSTSNDGNNCNGIRFRLTSTTSSEVTTGHKAVFLKLTLQQCWTIWG